MHIHQNHHFYQQILCEAFGNGIVLNNSTPTAGGCINNSLRLATNRGVYFLKWNPSIPGDMFEKEAKGLELLRNAGELKIPQVITWGKLEEKNYLLLENIEAAPLSRDYWEDFGRSLASLHKNHTYSNYGLDHDNYIGSLPQNNSPNGNWISFFVEKRLDYQLKLALQNGLVDTRFADRYRSFYKLLPGLLPVNPPSLLHGDLWSGNVMTGPDGKVCLIDPAVYYGHREIELAFTQMFGGFERRFYQAYYETWPLDPGYDERVDIYNMYPSMVHVNLFGTSYLSGVKRVLRRYV